MEERVIDKVREQRLELSDILQKQAREEEMLELQIELANEKAEEKRIQ